MPRPQSALVTIALVLTTAGCLGEPERGNPLDPRSPGFRAEGAVEGRVTEDAPPFAGLAGARLRLEPLDAGRAELATRSDADGRYRFAAVPEGVYRLLAEAEGFAADADTVAVAVGATVAHALTASGVPRVEAVSVRSVHVQRWVSDSDLYAFEVDVTASDPTGAADVAAATLAVPSLAFSAALTAAGPGAFSAVWPEASLPGGRVQALVGVPMAVEVSDTGGRRASAPAGLARVIEAAALPVRPQSLAPVSPTPTLEWEMPPLPYPTTVRVEVSFVNANVEEVVAASPALPAGTSSYALTEPLDVSGPGERYTWVVWIEDAFGNRSRSKEGGFLVVSPAPNP